MTRSYRTGRISFALPLSLLFGRFARCASAALLAAFLQCPAFLASCTQEATPSKQVYSITLESKSGVPEAVDLFFFDTLGIQGLDSYQQVTRLDESIYGLSGTGVKRLVALSGKAGEIDRWNQIRTYGNLCKHSFTLEQDSPDTPLLYAEQLLQDGISRHTVLELRPMLAAIRLHSVSCDFSGRPYAGSAFHNQQLFLSYAGAECLPLGAGDGRPVSWINPGYLDTIAVCNLKQPSMLWQEGCGTIGPARVYPDRYFYCYPGADTHLVLEGVIGETHCYYPIPLEGLEANACLQLDVTLRRMGSPSPDIPTIAGTILLEQHVLPWDERESYNVSY